METLKENSGYKCVQCSALYNKEVPAYKRVEDLFDRYSKVPLCKEHYEEWCTETESLLDELEEDDY